jgi:protein SCO1/2
MTKSMILRRAIIVLLLAMTGTLLYWSLYRKWTTETPFRVAIGGAFEMVSSKGGVVNSRDLVGTPYGMFFGFTHCPEVCPTTLYEMSESLRALGDQAKDFRLFFVTIDPQRDTPEKLKDYLSSFDPRLEALVPTIEQLPEIAKSFRVFYEKVPTSDGGYIMNHTATLYLFGRDGELRSTIAYGEERAARERKIKSVLADGT